MKKIFEDRWLTVYLDRNAIIDAEIVDKLIGWYVKHEMFNSEVLSQSDNTYLDGPILLMELAEELGFVVDYKDD